MLESSGLKIHPKQMELLKNQSVKQLIGQDEKFESIMKKATSMQKGIQDMTKIPTRDQEIRGIIEDNIKMDIAKQIAKEISQNIKITVDVDG